MSPFWACSRCTPFAASSVRTAFGPFYGGTAKAPSANTIGFPRKYPVTLYPVSAGRQDEGIQGTTINLSITGCMVETSTQVPQGTSVRLNIHGAGLPAPIEVESAVVRVVLENKLGLEFATIARAQDQRLRVFMEAHLLCRPR